MKYDTYILIVGCTGVALFHELFGVTAMWSWTAGFLIARVYTLIEMMVEYD